LEFSVFGGGDYRLPTFHARYADGSTVSEFTYEGYRIMDGKPQLKGLPSTYDEGDAQTLEITFRDSRTGIRAVLLYTIFEEYDVITRSIRYENCGTERADILSAQSTTVDFYGQDYKMLTLEGDWLRERSMEWRKVGHNTMTVESRRGMSSHMCNPFIALAETNATENGGDVYGFSLVYSGNFAASAEGNSCGGTRVTMGINPFNFEYPLSPGEQFQTPEVVMVYSDTGLNGMSNRYHRIYRERLCKGIYRDAERPMLINNWEGTGTHFTKEKLAEIARGGKALGLELFVLDDGWFGKRNIAGSLGDWYVNRDLLPDGLEGIANETKALDMKFGLWIEPEMISPESELYRAHPDWCIHAEGRNRTLCRDQLVLDLTRAEVRDYVVDVICKVIRSADISYIKWDCNRNITETASMRQTHDFVMGLYDILDRITGAFPEILFEGCSGGGGRFDPGMLYYMPQTWTSDDTNPIRRLKIQHGTSVVYPPVTMTAHVGKIDVGKEGYNHFLNTCAMVAMAGNFGYEMDLSLLSEDELEQAREYVEMYREIRPTVQFGAFYRIESPFEGRFVSWEFVDDTRAVLFVYQTEKESNGAERKIKLSGLDPNANYRCRDRVYSGEALMKVGLRVPLQRYEYFADCYVMEKLEG